MTTTAFDDQFTVGTQTIEPVRQPYSTEAILRRNVAALEVALRTQTELKERAEAELKMLARQEPFTSVVFSDEGPDISCEFNAKQFDAFPDGKYSLYLQPVPAPAVPAQVPEEWIKVMTELTADLQAACDAEHPHRDKYPSVMRKYNNDMEIVEKARALLQYAEVRHD